MSHSQFHSIKSFILRHAWLNLWDKRMLLAESTRLLLNVSHSRVRPITLTCRRYVSCVPREHLRGDAIVTASSRLLMVICRSFVSLVQLRRCRKSSSCNLLTLTLRELLSIQGFLGMAFKATRRSVNISRALEHIVEQHRCLQVVHLRRVGRYFISFRGFTDGKSTNTTQRGNFIMKICF